MTLNFPMGDCVIHRDWP